MREFLYQAGLLLFDDKKNDLRALPKTVRLQILVVLSLMWSVIFTVMFWSYNKWGLVLTTSVIGHVLVILGVYFTMKSFQNARQFNLRNDGYHNTTRSRQNLWVDGKRVELDKKILVESTNEINDIHAINSFWNFYVRLKSYWRLASL